MGSPGAEDRTYILSISIQDGRAFGPELQAVACAATFAGETKLTPYSVGRDTHVWNTTLQWRVTMDQFRRFTSLGQKDCKVVLSNKEGTKLGWFLVDVRAAKLQAQYKKTEGTLVSLTGAKKGETPQVCMVALFYEDRPGVSFSPEPKQSPGKSRAAAAARRRQAAARAGDAPPGADGQDGAPDPDQPSPPEAAGLPGDAAAGGEAGRLAAAAPPARNPTAGLPNFGSPGRNPVDEGPFRHFALTVDVRSFQSSKRLPLSSANVYVQAVLPADLIELVVGSGFRLPSRLAPLTSHPAVDIPRGAEGALPNGYGTLEFSAGVVQLARVLAREPRISVEAWHKERFRSDMLLGAGSVPLTPLLQGAWVDGYAPLFAMVASSVGGEVREERVQMGLLRVVLSLEDKGPAAPPGGGQPSGQALPLVAADAANAAAPLEVLRPRPSPYDLGGGAAASGPEGTAAGLGEPFDMGAGELNIREMHPPPPPVEQGGIGGSGAAAELLDQQLRQPPPLLPQAYSRAAPPAVSLGSPPALARGPAAVGAHGGMRPAVLPPGVAGAPEFEAAWELEVWKKAEEARWRAELREREAQRMLVLESEWRRRERAREAEIASLRAEYLAMEDKAQQALAAAEGRERRILAAEEALLRRRKELEREHVARMTEAEAAVRRLQVECEHQMDIERDRNAELVRRVASLEERLAASDMRCLTVENEFADFRAAARSTPEAQLARQLAEAREAVKAAEARAAKAAKAKQGYKEQVRKLADQMAALQRRQHRHRGGGFGGSDLDDSSSLMRESAPHTLTIAGGQLAGNTLTIRAAAEEQARYAASQQQELATMRAQLQAIKAAALAQLSPPGSPRGQADAGTARASTAAAGGAGGDEAADLRSSDQQRPGRAQWRIGGGDGRAAPHPGDGPGGTPLGPETQETPVARPAAAATNSVAVGSSGSSSGTSANNPAPDDGNFSSIASSAARQAQQQHRSAAAAGAGGAAHRWAEPRPAASAPPAGAHFLSSSPPEFDPGSSGRAASAPSAPSAAADRVSASTSMTRPVAAAVMTAAAAPPQQQQQQQQQRRGWALADRPREVERWEGAAQRGGGDPSYEDDDGDGRWDGNDRSRQQQQQRQRGPGVSAAVATDAGRPDDDDDDSANRRSLADHLAIASASSPTVRMRELQLPDRDQRVSERDPRDRSAAAASSPRAPGGPSRQGAPQRAGWQLPPQQQQQQQHQQQQPRQSPVSGGGDAEGSGGEPGDGGGVGGADADLEELRRLARRQTELLQAGYDPDDPVVELLNERIQALIAGR